jgi:hypothetical protein
MPQTQYLENRQQQKVSSRSMISCLNVSKPQVGCGDETPRRSSLLEMGVSVSASRSHAEADALGIVETRQWKGPL